MAFGDAEIIKERSGVKIIKVEGKYKIERYCVVGNGSTRYYDDYEDALEEYNLRWAKIEYEE